MVADKSNNTAKSQLCTDDAGSNPEHVLFDTAFPFVARSDATRLILGSMPGRRSLDAHAYYAHPQNAFWPIMGRLFGFDPAIDYRLRLTHLCHHRIALWDVAHGCIRPGSLDAAIVDASVVANDFGQFFQEYPAIERICFNGRKAESLYRKIVQPGLPLRFQTIEQLVLPSTSPAHASMSIDQKFECWQCALSPTP